MKVLVVDDEHIIAWSLCAILELNGFEARAAYDGKEALEMARSFRPDFLLSDVVMPGLDGVQTAIAIREFLPRCVVLFLSGQEGTLDRLARARSRGQQFDLALKPMHPPELLAMMRGLLTEQAGNVRRFAAHN